MLQRVYECLYDRKVSYLIPWLTVGLIATFCGATREEVYRALNELLRRGLVRVQVWRRNPKREYELVGDDWTDLKGGER